MFDDQVQWLPGRAVGAQGDEAVPVLIINTPEGLPVGLGQGQAFDFFAGKKTEPPLLHCGGQVVEGAVAAKKEQKPVGGTLVGFFRDHGEQMQVSGGDFVAGFFAGLAHGALEGRFAGGGLELAADGGPGAKVGRLGPQEKELFALGILDEH